MSIITLPTKIPTTRGKEVIPFLETHGIFARKAPIRSSDYEDLRKDQFLYYLKHRLGIQPAIEIEDALIIGSRVHKNLEAKFLDFEGPALCSFLERDKKDSLNEVSNRARAAGLRHDSTHRVLQTYSEAIGRADCIFELAQTIHPIPSRYTLVAAEPLLFIPENSISIRNTLITTPIVARFDAILIDETKKELWILDAKTTGSSPKIRMSTCAWEFQAQLYRLIITYLLGTGELQDKYSLPKDIKFMGMIHYIIRKPTHKILEKDRNLEKIHGPGYALLQWKLRAEDWFEAKGEFLKNRAEWKANPPINYSYTEWDPVEDLNDLPYEFQTQLLEIFAAATCSPYPDNFPRSGSYIRSCGFGKGPDYLSPYALFYPDESLPYWPDIIKKGFLLGFRDWPLPNSINN